MTVAHPANASGSPFPPLSGGGKEAGGLGGYLSAISTRAMSPAETVPLST
jgi:hypothetical protein